jgi:hypothetical protein
MNLLGIGEVVAGVGKIADDLFTSDEERLKVAVQEKMIDAQLMQGQMSVNQAEAQHGSVFVAGWRPAIGWVGAMAMAYQFILYPLLIWIWALLQAKQVIPCHVNASEIASVCTFSPPPELKADVLWTIVSGMLGIAGMRSYDKAKGTATEKVELPKKAKK